jgi:hypothetical protein
MGKDWFTTLFGFRESDYDYAGIQKMFKFDSESGTLTSTANGKTFRVGHFSTPSLSELREKRIAQAGGDGKDVGEVGDGEAAVGDENNVEQMVGDKKNAGDKRSRNLKLSVEFGDVSRFQADPENEHAVFQVASQFNCLEFVGPSVTPEHGVTGYVSDRTQGPACSVSCGPATVVRNYFVPVDRNNTKDLGQKADKMINNLEDFMQASGNEKGTYFKVQGGYTMTTGCPGTLKEFNSKLKDIPSDELMQTIRVGVHEYVQVTSHTWGTSLVEEPGHTITQVFASAAAVGYNKGTSSDWAPLSQLILDASYEAALHVGLESLRRHGKDTKSAGTVYLTLLGGGVFGNRTAWIVDAIDRACDKFCEEYLDVRVVLYSGDTPRELKDVLKKNK